VSGAQFSRELHLAFAPGTMWEEIAQKTAIYARTSRDELIAAGRFSPAYTTMVNGVLGSKEETLRPDGLIVYRANSIGPAVARALEYLKRNSPARRVPQSGSHNTGDRFRDSFFAAISRGDQAGRLIPADQFRPELVGADATEAFIGNLQPFNRLVDVQLEGGRKIQFSIDAGLYDRAATYIRRTYPALDAFRRYDIDFPGKYILQTGQPTKRRKGRGAKTVNSPALIISTGRR
jgi:hypothetical protein